MSADASTRDRGRDVEAAAARHLERAGLEILARNYEAAGAELDLVAVDRGSTESTYVFVEVRSRTTSERGLPLETIDRAKQRKVIRAATAWLVAHGLWEKVSVRFDAIGVTGSSAARDIVWIRDAFEA